MALSHEVGGLTGGRVDHMANASYVQHEEKEEDATFSWCFDQAWRVLVGRRLDVGCASACAPCVRIRQGGAFDLGASLYKACRSNRM